MSKPPLRFGVMQLTMEPLEEILGHAQQLDANDFDTIWLAEAYPWWRKHQMEARSSTALSALIGARDREADGRLGDHLALHPPPADGRDGRPGDARKPPARAASGSASAPPKS